MSISVDDIDQIALLARIGVTEDDKQNVTSRINAVLELVDQLQAVDTEQVDAMSHPMDATQVLRSDNATETDERTQLMSNAPSSEDGLFLVPKVIE